MSRISIDVTDGEHKKLKAMAALRGKSIKDYVLERTLGIEIVPPSRSWRNCWINASGLLRPGR
jgi:hypothetical protein